MKFRKDGLSILMCVVCFTLGMMLAHYQSQQWIGSKADQYKVKGDPCPTK